MRRAFVPHPPPHNKKEDPIRGPQIFIDLVDYFLFLQTTTPAGMRHARTLRATTEPQPFFSAGAGVVSEVVGAGVVGAGVVGLG